MKVSRTRQTDRTDTHKETTMNTFASNLYRDAVCAAAAAAITLMLSLSFIESTATVPGAHVPASRFVALSAEHAFFGQPEPAVLVD